MNAAPESQLRLLDVQALDSSLDRLAHRRRTAPEIARAAELTDRLAKLQDEIVMAETGQSDLQREQRKADADVEQVRTRGERDRQRLDSGAITSAKELESLQSEIASLHRRQSELEDIELDVMERLEQATGRVGELAAERDAVRAEHAAAESDRDAVLAAIDAEHDQIAAERAIVVTDLPDELVKLYENLRRQFSGVGAAPLEGQRCGGCHLTLNPAELARVRAAPDDEVVRCEECRRILVRGAVAR